MRKLIDSLKKYNNKNWCIYAFILGMLCYFITLSYCQLVFANYLYLEGDNIEIYAPISVQIANSIRCFNTPFYSFSYFLGHNASGLIASYGQIFSLTFWLILIFKNIDPAVLIFLSMVIRAGFSCMTFQIYASENLNKNRFICLLCSICYCMCSFQFAILEINQIWMDAFWLLPLIIIFIRKLVDEKKWIPLTVCYFYLFVTNFYMGYIVGIFSFIYFLSYIFIVKNIKFKQIIKDFLRFSFAVILAISLSSFLLLPAANYFLNAPLAKSLENFSLEINVLDVINQLFIGESSGMISYYPYIYCGLLSAICLPLFFISKRIKLRVKLFYLVQLLVLIFSCLFTPIYLFWHAFDVPDSWRFRFAFLISFILCSIACYYLRYLKDVKLKFNFLISFVYILIYIVEIILQKKNNLSYQSNDFLFLFVNLSFLSVISIMLYLYTKYRKNNKYNKGIIATFILLLATELVLNGYSVYFHNDDTKLSTLSSNYNQWFEASEQYLNEIHAKDDEKFYRIASIGDYISNSDSFYNYYGVSDFCSTENIRLRDLLKNLGIYTSPKLLLPFGYTDFTEMLLGVKYKAEYSSFNVMSYYLNHDTTYEELDSYNKMGFIVNPMVKEYKVESDNAFENINLLASSMIGEEIELYHKIPEEKVKFLEKGINFNIDDDGERTISILDTEDGLHYLDVVVPNNNTYIQFSNHEYSGFVLNSPSLLYGDENLNNCYGCLTASYIKPMELMDGYNKVTIQMIEEEDGNTAIMPDYYVAYYDKNEFDYLFNILKQNTLNITDCKNGYIEASVNGKKNDLLFVSIPYEQGWEAFVNGEKKEIVPLINDTFIGIELDEGINELVLRFKTPFARLGVVISLIGALTLLLLIIFNKRIILL